jgi:hypothetical protein
MEVITLESKAYKDLVSKIDKIADFVVRQEMKPEDRGDVWLDSNEVADALNISTRTLQRLRNENLISYTSFRGRCLYKLSEIERGLNERIIKCKPQNLEDFRKNYLLSNGKQG